MGYRVAVVGATGQAGGETLNILSERAFPADEVVALASTRSIGREVSFGENRTLKVKAVDHFDFTGIDIAFFSAGSEITKKYAPAVAAAGGIVIDKSSAFRLDPDVPLVIPEVNPQALDKIGPRRVIACPNCTTTQFVMALKPLHDEAKIKRVVVATYQSASGAGNEGVDELFSQTRAIYVNDPVENRKFPKQLAFNVIPQCDSFIDGGATKEEFKMAAETKKLLDPAIKVIATCVRVPVFVGHSEAVTIEFERPISVERARSILRESPGILVVDKREDGGYVTPIECVGEYATYVSRIRTDPTVDNGLALWIVSDNLRKGAALNAVQVAETLIKRGLLRKAA